MTLVLALVAITASAQPTPKYGNADQWLSMAKESVRRTLRDPDSARFRDMTQYRDGAICGEVNAKNAFGGYVGFRSFVFRAAGKSGHLQFGIDPIECSDTQNKPLVRAQAQLRSDIDSCSYATSESDSSCERARTSAALVKQLGGTPLPIPEPHMISFRKARESYELWAGLCEASGDRHGGSCRKASDAAAALNALGGKPRTRAEIRDEQLVRANESFQLWAPKCAAEQYKEEASSCRQAEEAAAKVKNLIQNQ